MRRINSDTGVAIFLLLLSGLLYSASYDIRPTNYGTMASAVWPRMILVVLALMSLVYLVRSAAGGEGSAETPPGGRGIRGWFFRYRNAVLCFALFAAFLLSLEWIGMLLGGILFVFFALALMGEGGWRNHVTHALVAVVSMGFMWLIFTFGLGVILPEGELFLAG
jgi:putative tricarboxylic transport membrane protein